MKVLQTGQFKIQSDVNVVRYVTFKLPGHTNQKFWGKTFSNRLTTMVAEGADNRTISTYMAADNKNKPVNAIWEQTLMPAHILISEIFEQGDLVLNA